MEQDPFISFLSNLTEKISVEKEHKALMEKINSEQPTPTVSPLEETLSRLQEKINQQVQAHIEVTTPKEIIKATDEIAVQPIKEIVIKEKEEEVLEEESFGDFVNKLKDILTSTKEIRPKPIREEKKKEEVPKIVEVKKEEPIVVAQEEKPVEVNNYIQELEKQSTPGPEAPANSYVAELDKISSKVAGVVEPEKVQDIKKLLEEYMEKYLKKAAVLSEYAGGGGSVAQQFADGGTMNGTLNVTGQYLSGGVDLATLFSTGSGGGGGGGNAAVNSVVISSSANWNNTYTTVQSNSASWGTGGAPQTLSFNSTNANLSISNGNTVSLSALSATGSSGNPAVNSLVISNSAYWNNSYTTLTANSAFWQSTYTTVSANSANWNNAYQSTTALNLSSAYWNTAYTLVQSNSATWNSPISAYSFIANGSTNFYNLSTTSPFTNAAAYIVSMNGAIQTPNTDFTITYSGTNFLNLNFTPRVGALITVQVLGNGITTSSSVVTVSASTYNPLYAYVNSNFSVNVPTGNYMVDTTTSGVTGLLPTTPTIGTVIGFMDPYYTWATNNFTLSAPVNIEKQNQSVAMNIAGYSFKAIYVGGSYGWRITQ